MAYESDSYLFRSLTDAEEAEFREYARMHDPELDKWAILHPVCRDEWTKRGLAPHVCRYCGKVGGH